MTGSEEGDPRTKSNLAKFDKVRIQAEKNLRLGEYVIILLQLPFSDFAKDLLSV